MRNTVLVLLEDSQIRFYRSDGKSSCEPVEPGEPQPSKIGAAMASGLAAMGRRKDMLVLGVPSRYFYLLNTHFDRNTSQNVAAVKYALEEHLPVDAEQMVPLVEGLPPNQLTLVLDSSRIAKILQFVNDEHGINFDRIESTNLGLVEHLVRQKSVSGNSTVMIVGEDASERFTFHSGQLADWKYFHGEPAGQDFKSLCADVDESCCVVLEPGVDQDDITIPDEGVIFPDRTDGVFLDVAAASEKKNVSETTFDFGEQLRSDLGLGDSKSSIWESLCLAILICLVCVAGALTYRAHCWNQHAIRLEDSVRSEFRQILPGRRINGPIERLLESELTQQRISNQLIDHANQSALLLSNLETLLQAMQEATKFRLGSLKVFPEAAELSGEVKTLGDLDALNDALKQAGYDVGTDSTYALQFRLSLTQNSERAEP